MVAILSKAKLANHYGLYIFTVYNYVGRPSMPRCYLQMIEHIKPDNIYGVQVLLLEAEHHKAMWSLQSTLALASLANISWIYQNNLFHVI